MAALTTAQKSTIARSIRQLFGRPWWTALSQARRLGINWESSDVRRLRREASSRRDSCSSRYSDRAKPDLVSSSA